VEVDGQLHFPAALSLEKLPVFSIKQLTGLATCVFRAKKMFVNLFITDTY
jgi:hypothetical protein